MSIAAMWRIMLLIIVTEILSSCVRSDNNSSGGNDVGASAEAETKDEGQTKDGPQEDVQDEAVQIPNLPKKKPAGKSIGPKPPKIWMCHGDAIPLFDKSQWDTVADSIDGIKVYIGGVEHSDPGIIEQLVKVLKEDDLKLSVEIGGTLEFMPLDDTNGEESAIYTIHVLKKIVKAGGTIDYLDMDGPIRRLMHPDDKLYSGLTLEQSVKELVDFMTMVSQYFPGIKFFILTNFPNWGYKGEPSYHAIGPDKMHYGDYCKVITKVVEETNKAGVFLSGITVDNPYEYAIGEHNSTNLDPKTIDWIARIMDLELFAKSNGLEFSMIFNSEKGGFQSDQLFYESTLKFIDVYKLAGGKPGLYMIQSWYEHPVYVVPEELPYSMTYLMLEVLNKIGFAK